MEPKESEGAERKSRPPTVNGSLQNPAARHNHILQTLKDQGYVTVSDLSETLQVSEVTIRRDLQNLEERNLLYRTHGGATPTNPLVYDRPVSEKAKQYSDEKRRIGEGAAKLVEPNDAIILASGTTMIQVARHLKGKPHLTVVTNAMNVAMELLHLPGIEIFMLGGMMRLTSTSTVGPAAESMIHQHACRLLFLGVDGFDLEHGLTTSNSLEAHLNREMITAAQQTVVVTDSSKFGLRGFSRICRVEDVDVVITDSKIPESFVKRLEDQDIHVVVV